MSSPPTAARVLRPGLLRDRAILVAGPAEEEGREGGVASLGGSVARLCEELGARVGELAVASGDAEQAESLTLQALRSALAEMPEGRCETLVVDGGGLFAGGGLSGCLQGAWDASRAAAQESFIGGGGSGGGRITLIAPAPAGGEHAGAAVAGLENLARTLSVEWARHGITTVTIAPGGRSSPSEVAALAAYLASPAGSYFSGCLWDLRGPGRDG